jgi:transposase-like protein
VLGLWAGQGGEGAKFWMSVLTYLRNRGIKDVFFVGPDFYQLVHRLVI